MRRHLFTIASLPIEVANITVTDSSVLKTFQPVHEFSRIELVKHLSIANVEALVAFWFSAG